MLRVMACTTYICSLCRLCAAALSSAHSVALFSAEWWWEPRARALGSPVNHGFTVNFPTAPICASEFNLKLHGSFPDRQGGKGDVRAKIIDLGLAKGGR